MNIINFFMWEQSSYEPRNFPPEQHGEKSVQTLLLEYQSTFTTVNWKTNKDNFFGAAAFFEVSSFVIFLFQFLASSFFWFDWGKKSLLFSWDPSLHFGSKPEGGGRKALLLLLRWIENSCKFSKMPQANSAAGNFCNEVASNFFQCFLFGKLVQMYAKCGVNKKNYFDLIETYVFRVAFFEIKL